MKIVTSSLAIFKHPFYLAMLGLCLTLPIQMSANITSTNVYFNADDIFVAGGGAFS